MNTKWSGLVIKCEIRNFHKLNNTVPFLNTYILNAMCYFHSCIKFICLQIDFRNYFDVTEYV